MPWPTSTPAWADLPGIVCTELGRRPGVPLGLPPGCELWLVEWQPDPPPDVLESWAGAVTQGERDRAERIGTRHGRLRLLASHAALARLAAATSLPNVSLGHTRWCAALAASARPVGVDIEADVPRPRWQAARGAGCAVLGDAVAPGDGAVLGEGAVPGEGAELGGSAGAVTRAPDGWEAFLRRWVEAEARLKAGVAGRGPAEVLRVELPATGARPRHLLALARPPASGCRPPVGLRRSRGGAP